MTTNLQDMRRRAGFASARDFAAAAGFQPTTYQRYEANADKIPVKAAWRIADALGTTIDAVVGRDQQAASAQRGPGLAAYAHLSPQGRRAADDYLQYLERKEAELARSEKARAQRADDVLCRRYERLFEAALDAEGKFEDLVAYAAPADVRRRFEEFVTARAAQTGGTEHSVKRIMDAYDRAWSTVRLDDGTEIACREDL